MTVTATAVHPYPKTLHPIHATLLAGTVPLFLGALLSDLAYWSSYQVEWANFASWLIAGGLVFSGLALLCALAGLFRSRGGERRPIYFLLLVAVWILGFINALVHARDAWAAMPTGLVLSIIVTLLAIAATGVGLSRRVGVVA
ncbi:MAG TPA: hypothetical protein PK177_12000 [Burkholderiaceae bacterium]|nr:hypothetical protein [Burkholderiaceae bacterium]